MCVGEQSKQARGALEGGKRCGFVQEEVGVAAAGCAVEGAEDGGGVGFVGGEPGADARLKGESTLGCSAGVGGFMLGAGSVFKELTAAGEMASGNLASTGRWRWLSGRITLLRVGCWC